MVISTLVKQAVSEGNQAAADRRLTYVADLELLEITEIADEIASMGFKCPQLCSPEELGGIVNDS